MHKTFKMSTKEKLIHNAMMKLLRSEERELSRHHIKLAEIRTKKDRIMSKCKHSNIMHIVHCAPQCVICGKILRSK